MAIQYTCTVHAGFEVLFDMHYAYRVTSIKEFD